MGVVGDVGGWMGWWMSEQAIRWWWVDLNVYIHTFTHTHAPQQTCVDAAEALVKRWLGFFQQLFVKYMDGNVKTQEDAAQPLPAVSQPGYSLGWRDRIVAETGDRFRVPSGNVGVVWVAGGDPMARDVAAVERREGGGMGGPRQRRRRTWKGM